jgi:phospholipid/cholesterol/gamma-HCH transport system substrate-binding protein
VKIGRVTSISFDDEMLEAVVEMRIDARYDKIPNDSDASILTQGILGGQYIGLEPGGSMEFFANDDEIQFTQSALVLEKLVSKYLFSQADKEE